MQCNSIETFTAPATSATATPATSSSGFAIVDGLAALQNYLADFSKELDQSQTSTVAAVASTTTNDVHASDDCYPSTSDASHVLYVDNGQGELVPQQSVSSVSALSLVSAGLGLPKSDESNNENLASSNVIPYNQPIILTLSQGNANVTQQQQSFLIPLNISGGNSVTGGTTFLLPINSFVSSEGVIELRVAAPSAPAATQSTAPILFLLNNNSTVTPVTEIPSSDGLCTVVIDNNNSSRTNSFRINNNFDKSSTTKSQNKRKKQSQKKIPTNELLTNNMDGLTFDVNAVVEDGDKIKPSYNADDVRDDRNNLSSAVDDVIKLVVNGVHDQLHRQELDDDDCGDEIDEDDDEENEESSKIKCLKTSFGSTTFQCEFCDYTNPKRYLMLRHMKSHSEDRPHKCPVCERRFKTPNSLQNHINTHTGFRPHQCKMCEASFTTSGEMVRHIRYRHTLEKPHKCPHCDYASVELSKLKRHMRSHSGERPYQCPNCLYASPDTYKLKRHMRVHTGEKPYECDVCLQRFTQSNSLKAHKKIHSGEKPIFQCDLCPSSCGRKTDLKIHVQKLHGQALQPVQCKKCSQTFPDRYSFKTHMKNKHDLPATDRSYRCYSCDYIAQSMRQLNLHMADDHGTSYVEDEDDVAFNCADCGLPFPNKSHLKQHRNESHPNKEKLYVCSFCSKRFSLHCNLIKHMENHERPRALNENDVYYKPKSNQKSSPTTPMHNELDEEAETDSETDVLPDDSPSAVNCSSKNHEPAECGQKKSTKNKSSNKRIRFKPEQLGLTNVRRRGRPMNPTSDKSQLNSQEVASPKKPRRSIFSLDDDQKAKDVENLFGFASPSVEEDCNVNVATDCSSRDLLGVVTSSTGGHHQRVVVVSNESAPETSMEPLLVISDHATTSVATAARPSDRQPDCDSDDFDNSCSSKSAKFNNSLIIDNPAMDIFDLTSEERLEIVTLANAGTVPNDCP